MICKRIIIHITECRRIKDIYALVLFSLFKSFNDNNNYNFLSIIFDKNLNKDNFSEPKTIFNIIEKYIGFQKDYYKHVYLENYKLIKSLKMDYQVNKINANYDTDNIVEKPKEELILKQDFNGFDELFSYCDYFFNGFFLNNLEVKPKIPISIKKNYIHGYDPNFVPKKKFQSDKTCFHLKDLITLSADDFSNIKNPQKENKRKAKKIDKLSSSKSLEPKKQIYSVIQNTIKRKIKDDNSLEILSSINSMNIIDVDSHLKFFYDIYIIFSKYSIFKRFDSSKNHNICRICEKGIKKSDFIYHIYFCKIETININEFKLNKDILYKLSTNIENIERKKKPFSLKLNFGQDYNFIENEKLPCSLYFQSCINNDNFMPIDSFNKDIIKILSKEKLTKFELYNKIPVKFLSIYKINSTLIYSLINEPNEHEKKKILSELLLYFINKDNIIKEIFSYNKMKKLLFDSSISMKSTDTPSYQNNFLFDIKSWSYNKIFVNNFKNVSEENKHVEETPSFKAFKISELLDKVEKKSKSSTEVIQNYLPGLNQETRSYFHKERRLQLKTTKKFEPKRKKTSKKFIFRSRDNTSMGNTTKDNNEDRISSFNMDEKFWVSINCENEEIQEKVSNESDEESNDGDDELAEINKQAKNIDYIFASVDSFDEVVYEAPCKKESKMSANYVLNISNKIDEGSSEKDYSLSSAQKSINKNMHELFGDIRINLDCFNSKEDEGMITESHSLNNLGCKVEDEFIESLERDSNEKKDIKLKDLVNEMDRIYIREEKMESHLENQINLESWYNEDYIDEFSKNNTGLKNISIKDFEFKHKIGSGDYGKVDLYMKKSTNDFYAIKSLNLETMV